MQIRVFWVNCQRAVLAPEPGLRFLEPPAYGSAPLQADLKLRKLKISKVMLVVQGRQSLDHLVSCADVFVTNHRPDVLKRLDLDPEALVSRYPRLIACAVSGYGTEGLERDRPGGSHGKPSGSIPVAGQHTEAMLREAGVEEGLIAQLLSRR